MDKLTAAMYRIQEIKCVVSVAHYDNEPSTRQNIATKCWLCNNRSGTQGCLEIGIFHGFMFGGVIPLSCDQCGCDLLQVRPVSECLECFSKYPKVFQDLATRRCFEENIRFLAYSMVINKIITLDVFKGD